MPNCLQNAYHVLVQEETVGDFEASVRMTMTAGGCNSSRAAIVGSSIAAMMGAAVIPDSWINNTTRGADVVKLAHQLVALRESKSAM